MLPNPKRRRLAPHAPRNRSSRSFPLQPDSPTDIPPAAPLKVERGFALWLFGPPAAGKTTVAKVLKERLEKLDVPVVLFDGDVIRGIVGEGIGRSAEDRVLLTRRYCSLTSYLSDSRVIIILAAINHTNAQRAYARDHHRKGQFGLVWINTPLDTCMERDPKGLYVKAREAIARGESPNVVGLDIAFEDPLDHDVVIATETETPEAASAKIVDFLVEAGSLKPAAP